jgi:hypothetical protein
METRRARESAANDEPFFFNFEDGEEEAEHRTAETRRIGTFLFIYYVWAIRMTSCFVYSRGRRHRGYGIQRPGSIRTHTRVRGTVPGDCPVAIAGRG